MFDPLVGCQEQQYTNIIYPPEPIKSSQYFCGKYFLVNSLIPMYQIMKTVDSKSDFKTFKYGIACVSGKDAGFYTFQKSNLRKLSSLKTKLQKKQKKGGQSAQRFGRIRLEKRARWIKKICENIDRAFLDISGESCIDGLIVAGPASIKSDVCKSGNCRILDQLPRTKVHIISSSEQTKILEIVGKIPALFTPSWVDGERTKWKEFLNQVDQGSVVFGCKETLEHLESGEIKQILISESEKVSGLSINDWDVKCQQVGAKIHIFRFMQKELMEYGEGVVGIKWF